MSLIYTTGRVVKIPSKILYVSRLFFVFFITIYIIGYGIFWTKNYQATSRIESVVVTKVKGVLKTAFLDKELGLPNADLYNRIWDASDLVIPSNGEESGGFFILTDLVITPNQTRGVCPESVNVEGADCTVKTKKCVAGKSLPLGNGYMTGKCVSNNGAASKTKTCEVEAWCPVEQNKRALNGKRALLEGTKDFTVLIKNSIEFPQFGSYYKRRNIMDSATPEYLKSCLYNTKENIFCPTFRLGDIVAGANEKYEEVAKTGAVFAIKIGWFCDFDFGKPIKTCRPRYSFARMDNPHAPKELGLGFNFLSSTYHEENRRTLTRNYGLKFIIDVEGEGRKFDPIKLILAIGASVGLFALASKACDIILGILCRLRHCFDWKCLQNYSEDMKYDLSHIHAQFSIGDNKDSELELDEVQVRVLKHK